MYIIKQDNVYAHGKSIKEAREDLLFKIAKKDSGIYKNLSLSSKISKEEAIVCYRIITGACRAGVQNFIDSNNLNNVKTISIEEIINMTNSSFGGEKFKNFFHERVL